MCVCTRLNSRPLRLFTILHFLLARLTVESREVLVLDGGVVREVIVVVVVVVVTRVVGREPVGFEGKVLLV